MSFTSRITRLPIPHDPDRGAEARAAVPELSGDLATLVEGAGGSAPYLKALTEKEAEWLPGALDDPEAALDAVFAAVQDAAPDVVANVLRQAKRRVALLTALADLAGVWPLMQVTGALTRLADLATHAAMRACVGNEIRRGKLPGATEDDLDRAGGMVALAMGKMGAGELNYSSDIDLICLFDETRFDEDDWHEARASFVRATRKMAAMLSDMTAEGYVFRTDLRLRPDPSVTPVCMSMAAAETYYESLGRTWERAAYIKARACAGDIDAGEKFLKTLRPFVFRKHLDFAAIQDAHDMRLRIREHKGLGGPITLPGHNMKLGRGGIREIEFFTQTRQLIAGGRDPDLRVRGTLDGLEVLARKEWIPGHAADVLADHYVAHREVEHRLQMINDAQTHDLPTSDDGFARLACLMGRQADALKSDIHRRLTEVHEVTESFFAPDPQASQAEPPAHAFNPEILDRWKSYPALRSARAVEIFDRLRPDILDRLGRTAKPDEALLALDGFLAGLPAGVQLFSLFEANPQLIDLLVDIVGTSPALAAHLSRNSGVFDAVIGGDFFAEWPGMAALRDELAARIAPEDDYERKLDSVRRWAKEWHFRIGVHHLRGLIDADTAGRQYADLAEACLAALYPVVVAQFTIKHGPPPGRGAMVLGMGSMGAARLNATSDLDLIVIYDAAGVESSDGRRPLAARAYYARLTQAMVTAVTAQMAEGRLYEIDMRLRPSGTQGPVATSLASFENYQKNEAWLWEHLALTRARPVAGETGVAEDVEKVRREALTVSRDAAGVLKDVRDMRARIAAAKPPAGPWDAKLGKGRLQDVELVAQAGALLGGGTERTVEAGLACAAEAGWLENDEINALDAAHALCWKVQAVSKLLSDKAFDPDATGEGGCAMMLRETGFDDLAALERALTDCTAGAGQIVDKVLERLPRGLE
ncbi:glutamine-synthetase adenylyltransferase [Lutimaribacter sp. EGI FJ00015]|uniref:Glutamine-synthetase adenylyltransferase n=1 Tax=Lutimaribacter degradans TaxID=2945989 RepID=A0ACC5ZWE0_9RHOB|nr:glutamine-synthetase adenylyltransferase [Lutimaribacter sp. EGI FJ00013]MCM2562395.1 glutamine-synthetase adenylyltransferase [Lutimaribacter sp. EGI FJ00013]MCO0613552.1 glutamine-synthetase adenylyltransferase [Lutimaribacter sp. EGI FJ00015]MCO0636524.1 glutamine-synthetase adenylyltransferase [Lutimaribacter sp. EGI FJ00014]